MTGIAKLVMQNYADHNRTRGPGEDFVALSYCRTGRHRSIAAAKGLQNWVQYDHNKNTLGPLFV